MNTPPFPTHHSPLTTNHSPKMAGVTGLEPATFGVTGRRSNQLSYTPVWDRELWVSGNKTNVNHYGKALWQGIMARHGVVAQVLSRL